MHLLFHRYEKLRVWSPWRNNALSGPVVLDRGRAQWSPRIQPYERFAEADGRLFPAVAGGIGLNGGFSHMRPVIGFDLGDTGANFSTQDINTAYTAGSAGIAIGVGGAIPLAKTLSALYFNINAYHGTAANVTSINAEVRAHTAYKPNTGIAALATATVNPLSQTGWIKSGTLTASIAANTLYWFIVANAAASGTDYITVLHRDFNTLSVGSSILWNAASTANGWSTLTIRNQTQGIVAIFTDGTAAGDPFTAFTASALDTNQRGLYIDGVTEKLEVYGVVNYIGSNVVNATGVRLWEGNGGGPAGSPARFGTERLSTDGAIYIGCLFSAPYTLIKNTPYRFVYYGSTNWNAPHRRQIGTVATTVNSGSAAELAKAFPGGGSWYYTKETAGAWVDTTTEFPMMDFYVLDQVAGGGGGGGVAGGGGGAIILG